MRSFMIIGLFAAALAACSPPASKTETPAAEIAPAPVAAAVPAVSDAWAAITPDGAKVGAGYMRIVNPGGVADKLVSVASARAGKVEIHEMKMDGAMMSMAPVAGGVEIPAGGAVTFEPGGLHLMFMEITAPFKDAETVPVTLTFEQGGAVEAALTVRKPDAAAASGH
jgi:hypothetical protein